MRGKHLCTALAVLLVCSPVKATLKVGALKVNNLSEPVSVPVRTCPKASWILQSDKTDTYQKAYRIDVLKDGKLVWTSGKVEGRNSTGVPMDCHLKAKSRYDWRVQVWDNHGSSARSATAKLMTEADADENWKAQWIGCNGKAAPIYLRKEFKPEGTIKRATAYVSARGLYNVCLDGKKITDAVLTPGWTSYRKRIQYQVYDVTPLLTKSAGKNTTVSAIVAPGWYSGGINWGKVSKRYRYGDDVALFLQIEMEYSDGRREIIATDGSWEMSGGPVCFANIYDGQTTDNTIAFDWKSAEVLPATEAALVPSVSESVTRRAPLKVVKYFVTPRGEKVMDFGQNITGWEKFSIKGNRGDTIRVRHAEVLDSEGNFYTENLRDAKATSTYILSGRTDSFEPEFTFYGFRYISIEGLEGDPDPAAFEAVPISSGFEDTGSFSCSDTTINRLQSNIFWGFRDNFVDVPTDCPQRDERLGWTGDAQVFFRTATFLGDVGNFFRKWLADLDCDQRADGQVTRVVPDTFPKSKSRLGATGWADCATLIPWQHYMAYGDVSILADQWDSMKKWVDFCISEASECGWLMKKNLKRHFGDWLFYSKDYDPDGQSAVTGKALIASAFFAESVRIVADAAILLGKADEAAYYKDIYGKTVTAFRNEYVTPAGALVSDTQTAYTLALKFNLIPKRMRGIAAKRLVDNIHSYKDHITTGFLGTPYICEVLTDCGYSDVAYTLLMQKTCPSWIYPISKGATTIWERWDSIKPDGTIIKGMNSFNHYSFGAIGDWLYRSALGIRETKPGYETFEVAPHAGGGITHMEGSTMTPYGRIAVKWQADTSGVINHLEVDVPVGTTATIRLGDNVCSHGSGHWTIAAAGTPPAVEAQPAAAPAGSKARNGNVREDLFPDGTAISGWFRDAAPVDIKALGRQFVITDYGIKPSGDIPLIQTEKIQALIDSVADIGGGVIVIPKGTFVSGTLDFKQGVHLYLEEGAVLKGSDFIGDFRIGPTRIEGENCTYFGALVQADGVDGFTICGKGTIDGNGWSYHRSFWLRKKWNKECTNKDEQRPRLVYISNSKNIRIDGITLCDSPFWTTHYYRCENVKLTGLTITSVGRPKEDSGPSTDAIDLDVVNNVLVKNCRISVNDDGIALKGGKGPWADDPEKYPGNGSNTNVIIEDCEFGQATHCCLTLGSESIHNRNIVMRRCKADCPSGILFRLKIRRDTPQNYEYASVYDCEGSAHRFFHINIWNQFFDLKGRKDEPVSYASHIKSWNCKFSCDKKSSLTADSSILVLDDINIDDSGVTYKKQ